MISYQIKVNWNRSLITKIPKDLHTSIQPYTTIQKPKIANPNANNPFNITYYIDDNPVVKYTDGDRSNYRLGIPFADSDDFMGGISTANSTIHIQMTGKRPASGFNTAVNFGQPTMIITQDCLLKIWT